MEASRNTIPLTQFLDQEPDARLVVDDEGLIRYANPATATYLGRGPKSLLGQAFPYPLPAAGAGEVRIAPPEAPVRVAEVRVRDILWNECPALLVSLRDVTDRRRMDRIRSEVEDRMRAVELKRVFLSRLSHELRSPLTIVKAAITCLRDGHAGPMTRRQLQFIDMACRNVDRQTRMIDNILDLARLQSGRARIDFRPVDLAALIAEVAEEFRVATRSRRLVVDLPRSLPPAKGDPELVAQVLRNLLDNAVRFSREKVTVKASAGDDGICVSVADDGAGIPKDRIGDLFNEYVQVGRSTGGRGYKGTGLGLAICREIIRGHEGRIWAESLPGKGSRFHFVLCRDRSTPGQAPAGGPVAEAEGRDIPGQTAVLRS